MSGWTQAMVTKRELGQEDAARKNRRSISGKRADLGNRFFRSKMEANIARYLNWMQDLGAVSKWEYETEEFGFLPADAVKANEWWRERGTKKKLGGLNRGIRFYKIDFKIWFASEPQAIYWECKGWMDTTSKTKLRRMEEYHPWLTIKVIGSKEYRDISRQSKNAIAGWE